MQSIQTREENTLTRQVNKRSWVKGSDGRVKTTGHRRVCSIHSRKSLREGFDKVGSYAKLPSNVIKVGDVRGETTGRGRAVRGMTFDRNVATADAASIARR